MSKLADAMRRAQRREARPIGFAAGAAAKNPSMLLLARVATAEAAAAVKAGADAVILTDGAAGSAAPAGAVWGVEAGVDGRDAARALVKSGADFVVFDADTTDAAVLLEDKLGFIMRIGLDAEDTLLRVVENLSLDALLVPGHSGPLTVRQTLDLRRVAAFARKPLLLTVPPTIDVLSLETLRDCGAVGVLVEGAKNVATVHATIDALPARRRARDGRGATVALRATGDSYEVPDQDEMPEPQEEPA